MGLQNQLSDVSSESFLILTIVLLAKIVRYVKTLLLRLFPKRSDSNEDHFHFQESLYLSLANITLLCDQLNLNRYNSYLKRSAHGADRFGSDCVVCLNRLGDGDHVRKLACRHVFHKECFDGWLQHLNFSCPVCRAPQVSQERVEEALVA